SKTHRCCCRRRLCLCLRLKKRKACLVRAHVGMLENGGHHTFRRTYRKQKLSCSNKTKRRRTQTVPPPYDARHEQDNRGRPSRHQAFTFLHAATFGEVPCLKRVGKSGDSPSQLRVLG
ncbi:unnamed protein product, partial [Ectocarpus sp. 12 AP-2014]